MDAIKYKVANEPNVLNFFLDAAFRKLTLYHFSYPWDAAKY
eukprot:CAMPEP_0185261200 /NCGR_PEP_ID=MMETSP1359-20130426/9639_1 /TAXON_ID=552665 /ORGANISM="Bigelowiella longifila, Strain CCMP242" /LENGTH=40 /DNA_ID= /DNA_START= /DNA_END= /DNA_ORIENTATION=